jgi:hypothetical protein
LPYLFQVKKRQTLWEVGHPSRRQLFGRLATGLLVWLGLIRAKADARPAETPAPAAGDMEEVITVMHYDDHDRIVEESQRTYPACAEPPIVRHDHLGRLTSYTDNNR